MTRLVLITGVAGGIGRAAAAAFRRDGWSVVGVDRTAPTSDLSVDEFVRADLATDDAIPQLVDALDHVDELHALVNNAALQVNRPLVETSDDDWAAVMDTNLRAAFRLIRAFHPPLAAAGGAVVNVSSVHAVATSPNVAAYAISKGALVSLTRTAALELAPAGIRCNAVLPGAVMTAMLEDGLSRRDHPDGPDGNLTTLVERTPLGFVATPEQIAPTIVFLADAGLSPYTTGQALVVDGGATIRLGTE